MATSAGFEKNVAARADMPLYERFRHEFPISDQWTYLNHAAVAPLCRRAAEAMKSLADQAMLVGSVHYDQWMATYEGLRVATAKLINSSPREIAIVKNTSEGIATVAMGLDWRVGDRVVAFREEFPANYFPWLRLEQKGVELTWLSIYDPLDRVAEAVKGARLLAISYVNYLSGYRVDLEAIGKICRDADCFFFVDAIQGMGVYPLDVQACHIDALSADGHKWMLGPEGNGVLYVRQERLDSIEPVEFGWTNAAGFNDYASRDMSPRADAGRYECGTLNTVGCYGQRASIELLLEADIPNIASAVTSLTDRLYDGVRQRGYIAMQERTPQNCSGIVSFKHPTIDNHVVVSKLKQQKVTCAPRQGWVRMSPHFYISPEQIDSVLDTLPPV